MSESIYHVRKVSLGLKRKYRVSADDGAGKPGALIGYAEKELKVADEIVIYVDEERTERLATVRESGEGFLASLTGYEVFDAQDQRLGSFGVLVKKSVERTTWEVEQPGIGRFTGTERSLKTARLRRLVSLAGGTAGEIANAVTKYHFDFARDDDQLFSIEKPKVLDDWYRLTVHHESLDRTLLFALAITMEARQRG
ncbi:hypothetical protein [Luteipulveratus mongoliensis]|uniref:hypothetical protein n=1 Tax=Luteipulveratus mongoliensis TaxID=571913 RepID=UPI0006980C5B|nr:hypothetical protein [Luteipulveratus mongoliensis]